MFDDHVLASFTRRSDAELAARDAAVRFPGGNARVGDTDDALDVLALGQEAEVSEAAPLLSSGMLTGPYARGALLFGSVGLVVGALLGVAISFLLEPAGVDAWKLSAACALAGALAVSTVAAVLGAGRQAVKEGATTPEDPTAIVRVETDAAHADPIIAFFIEQGARSAHFIDHPIPRRPTADVEAPRPSIGQPSSENRAESDAGFTTDVR